MAGFGKEGQRAFELAGSLLRQTENACLIVVGRSHRGRSAGANPHSDFSGLGTLRRRPLFALVERSVSVMLAIDVTACA